jgi:anti-anti-sigma factor
MSFTLSLIKQEDSGFAILAAEGEITCTDFTASNNVHFDNILGPHWDTRFVALDMERVNYIDSSAIGWLLAAHKSFRAGGGKLFIHSVQPQVRQIFDILKIDRAIPLFPDLKATRAAIQPYLTPVNA